MSMCGVVPQILDVPRALSHCKVLNVYIQAPCAHGLDLPQCLRLKRCWCGTRDAGQAFEFAVRDDFEVNNFTQGANSPCLQRPKTRRSWYFVHGDDYVELCAEMDLEWYRQLVSQRFILKLRVYLGPAAYHKREMRILNRVLTWRSSEAGRDEMITRKETHDTWASCWVTMAWSTGRAGSRQYLGTSSAFLAKNPLAGAYLLANQTQEPTHETFVHCIGSTRRSVRKQGDQQGGGAADHQRGRNTAKARQVLLHSTEAAVVLPVTAHASQDRGTQRCQLCSMPCDTEELMLHKLDAGETSDLCWNLDASCDLSVIRTHTELWNWH